MRCLVIDDDPRDRELVERMVVKAGHEATGAAGGPPGIELAKSQPFDVALVDLGMEEMGGVEVLRNLHKAAPELRLLVVSGFDDKVHVLDAVAAGADGYILKSEIAQRLAAALDEVLSGGGPMSAKIATYVLEELRKPEGAPPGDDAQAKSLSTREWEVLQGLSHGYTYAEIAANLHISVNTVRHHIRNLYGKLDVSGKAEAVTRALASGRPLRPEGDGN